MESPMPNNVVVTIHLLTAASNQAGGITFTIKYGNILTNKDDKETNNRTDKEPIPVADNSPADEDPMAIGQQEHTSHETEEQ